MEILHGIKVGDRVRILIGEGDSARYGMTSEMRTVRGEVGTVKDVCGKKIMVAHPAFPSGFSYLNSEVEKVKEQDAAHKYKEGDIVKIVGHEAYGSNPTKEEATGGYGTVVGVSESMSFPGDEKVCVLPFYVKGEWFYAPRELSPVAENAPVVEPFDTVCEAAAVPEKPFQSRAELVAENESLEKQIRKLEALVERKKEYHRKNSSKIAAWRVILEQ